MKIAVAVLLCLLFVGAHAQDSTSDRHYVYSPREVDATLLNVSIGPSLTMLPQPLTEYPTPAPMLDVHWRLTTPYDVHGYGRFGSNYATSIAQAGAMYAHTMGSVTVGAGYSVAFVYGSINFVDGFNTTQQRWVNYPMITTSVKFDKLTLTGRAEAEILTSLDQRIEDQVVDSDANLFSGVQFTLAAEQPFWNNTHVLIGATVSFSSNPYQAWFIYNTFKERLFSSELFFGFIL